MAWRILKYIEHLFYRKHRYGHGIHSPSLFAFVQEVIFDTQKVVIPKAVTAVHSAMRKDSSLIPEEAKTLSISSFVKRSSVTKKYGALLFRISRWIQPEISLELGTGLGISTIYLSAGYTDSPLHTIEGSAARAKIAEDAIKRCDLKNVIVQRGDLDWELESLLPFSGERMMVFMDANHTYESTLRYLRKLMEGIGPEAVIVMDDIYWSKGMYRAWKEVISWPEVRMSIDLFHMGILLLRKDLHKTHLKVKF